MTVAIVSYGLGNVGSMQAALDRIGRPNFVAEEPRDLRVATHLVLPGVGSFATASELLHSGGWADEIKAAAESGVAILGICLGMQLLAEAGDEFAPGSRSTPGLGLIPGVVTSLVSQGCDERMPHIGWNSIRWSSDSVLLQGVAQDSDVYFVHSFALELPNATVSATTHYGVPVAAAVEAVNVFGTQFHPEKSSYAGHKVLTNFCSFTPC